jgi:hypothetical protein
MLARWGLLALREILARRAILGHKDIQVCLRIRLLSSMDLTAQSLNGLIASLGSKVQQD